MAAAAAAAAAVQVAELVTQLSMLSAGAAIVYPAPLPPAPPSSAPTGAEVAKGAVTGGGASGAAPLAAGGAVGRALAVGRPSVFAAPAPAWLELWRAAEVAGGRGCCWCMFPWALCWQEVGHSNYPALPTNTSTPR